MTSSAFPEIKDRLATSLANMPEALRDERFGTRLTPGSALLVGGRQAAWHMTPAQQARLEAELSVMNLSSGFPDPAQLAALMQDRVLGIWRGHRDFDRRMGVKVLQWIERRDKTKGGRMKRPEVERLVDGALDLIDEVVSQRTHNDEDDGGADADRGAVAGPSSSAQAGKMEEGGKSNSLLDRMSWFVRSSSAPRRVTFSASSSASDTDDADDADDADDTQVPVSPSSDLEEQYTKALESLLHELRGLGLVAEQEEDEDGPEAQDLVDMAVEVVGKLRAEARGYREAAVARSGKAARTE